LDQANIALLNGAKQYDTKNFEQAWNHNGAKDCENRGWLSKKRLTYHKV
jgi:hypothetical protein